MAVGILVLAASLGIVQNCTSLFVPEICKDLNVSRTSTQLLFSFFSIGSVAASVLSPLVYMRHKPARVMKIAVLFLAPLYYLNSLARAMWQFYLIALLVGFTQTYLSVLPITLIISNWFKNNKGKIIGITLTGSTLGGALFNQVAGRSIPAIGYRQTYALLAGIMLICTAPAILLLIKNEPDDETVAMTGQEETTGKKISVRNSYRLADLKKQPMFWAFLIAVTLSSISGISANTTISPHLVSLGYTTQRAAAVVSIVMLAMTAGKFILGSIFDALGVKKATVLSQVFLCLTFVGLLLSSISSFLILVVIGVGLGGVLVTVGYPLIVEYSFGNDEYPAIYGLVTAFSQAGNMLASAVTGVIYDIYNSYDYSFILLIVLTVISTAIILLTIRKYQSE